jgi:hypothetical protein
MPARAMAVGRAERTSFDLPFSQEIMADVLGLSVPHLNRVMQQLRRAIDYQPRTADRIDRYGELADAGALPAAGSRTDAVADRKGLRSLPRPLFSRLGLRFLIDASFGELG